VLWQEVIESLDEDSFETYEEFLAAAERIFDDRMDERREHRG
jgi:hypothetical protein